MDSLLYGRRRATNFIVLSLSFAATAAGLLVLFLILWSLLRNGVPALGADIFTQNTPPPGSRGGLLNAIYGSLVMTTVATLIGTPVGILCGTFLAEFSRSSRLAMAVRFINDILLSAPSIVIGLFVYVVMVVPMGHFSAWAGSVALAIIVIPVVVRTSENMLSLVPASLREAAFALGTPQWKVVIFVVYRAALQGMLTGVLLAVARIAGETAPLLFTVAAPTLAMTLLILTDGTQPFPDVQQTAWTTAFVLLVFVLALSIAARLVAWRLTRRAR